MTGRRTACLAAVSLAAFAAVTSADAAPAAPKPCGTIKIAGKTWAVTATAVPCATAKSIVRKLATKSPPRVGPYPGKFSGMTCVALPPGTSKPKGITCQGGGRLVIAGVKPG